MNRITTLEPDKLFKAFADPTRLRILNLLSKGELCVCTLNAILQLPQSTVSRHLAYLKKVGFVQSREEGTWNHYSLPAPASQLHQRLVACVAECLCDSKPLKEDMNRLKQCC